MNRKSERGQVFIIVAFFLLLVGLPFLAWLTDQGFLYLARRHHQKVVDSACLAGAIAAQNGDPIEAEILASFVNNGVDPSYYTPYEGSGVGLVKGIELWPNIRVRMLGPTTSILSHFLGNPDGLIMAAEAYCKRGLGGFLPLALKEWEGPGSKILKTDDPNDEWSGACPLPFPDPSVSPIDRSPPNCWVWGDWQVLAGDGHRPNEGGISMNGLIAPDVRCEHLGQKCTSKVYIPPVPEGVAVNTLKSYTKGYIAAGGYDGPLPIPGIYTGVNSALIAQQEGVSNNFLAQEIAERYGVGSYLIVFVYGSGELYPGNKNFDYVEVIGYAVVKIVYIDANTVAVVPVYPATNEGDLSIEDDLPKSPQEIGEAGYDIYPVLLPWDY
ncbi:MAG: pilus assembly protein TadG-related protein [Microgenomates group bacterium]